MTNFYVSGNKIFFAVVICNFVFNEITDSEHLLVFWVFFFFLWKNYPFSTRIFAYSVQKYFPLIIFLRGGNLMIWKFARNYYNSFKTLIYIDSCIDKEFHFSNETHKRFFSIISTLKLVLNVRVKQFSDFCIFSKLFIEIAVFVQEKNYSIQMKNIIQLECLRFDSHNFLKGLCLEFQI